MKVQVRILFVLLLVITAVNCRENDESATPAPTATAVPPTTDTATTHPTPTTNAITALLAEADPLHPRMVGQLPAAGEELPLEGTFEIYFDQPMHPEQGSLVQVVDEAGNVVEGEVSWPQPRILRFTPGKRLTANSHYQVVVAETAVSANGIPLLEPLTLDYYTIGDLSVSQFIPADNALNVAVDSSITVIFNRPVVPLLMSNDQANLPNPLAITPETSGRGEWVNTSVYVFRPDAALIGRSKYTVRVLADVVNAASATEAQMPEDFVSTFTVTPPTFDTLELVSLTWQPRSGYENLPLDQVFRLHFHQPMDPARTETAVTLQKIPDQTNVPLQFSWDETNTTATITPTQLLELSSSYRLQIDVDARSAQGGRLGQPFSWMGHTYKYPAIIRTEPANGTTEAHYSSSFRIYFASPMDEESLKGKVQITPDIRGDVDGLYNMWNWSSYYYGLDPSTDYTIEILPGMRDLYGNEITTGMTVHFRTADLMPSATFNLPYSVALYRSGGSESLWVSHNNVDEITVDLYKLPLPEFGQLLNGDLSRIRFVPGNEQRVWQHTTAVDTPLNILAHERFAIAASDTGQLPTGYYFLTLDSPQVIYTEPHLQAQVMLMSTANVILKKTATEAMIWVTDLNTGEPLPHIPVALYNDNFQEIFTATTDELGLVYRDDLELRISYDSRYYAVAGAPGEAVFGLAVSQWDQGISPYDFGINTDYYLQPNQPTAYVYTERPIYRPGQPVYFKGIIRHNDDLHYSLPTFDKVTVSIASFDEEIYSAQMSLSAYGSFEGEIELDDEAALGSYQINVVHQGESIGYGFFEVAEFRKPTFQVNVTAVAPDLAAGDTIMGAVEARFFSGGSLVNSDVQWHVRSQEFVFNGGVNGAAYSRYSFRNRERDLGYYYYNRDYSPTELIAEGSGQTDGQGQLLLEIPAELNDSDGSRLFTIEATVTDLAGNQVSSREQVIVHRSQIYPGIAANQSVGLAGEPASFDLIAVDWDGNPVSGQPLSLEVVERRWYSVQEEDDDGRTIWRTSVEEIPVAVMGETTVVTDGNGRSQFSFIPPNGGVYRAYVTATDAQGNSSRSSTYIWVSGSDYVPWRRVNDHSFELINDKSSYQPGETAEILIASPFQGETAALVTVERGHIKTHEVIHLVNNSTIYRLPITGDMAPNVFVSVLVMKGVDETNPAPDFKLGMTQFTVSREEQELKVTVVSDETAVQPGDTVNYTIEVTDHNGQPVAAELSLSLTDLAVLTIASRKELPILDYFYSEKWLSVQTATFLALNMDAYNQELEDEIKGGGGGGNAYGVQKIREEFPDTTFWKGQLVTDANGRATVSITLPDNLTTWRMDVRAVTQDTKVGQATQDIISTLPVLVSPQTPRFFVVGDTTQLGTAVHNNTDEAVTAVVSLEAVGVTLADPQPQTITIPARQQAFVTWQATVEDVTRVDLIFYTHAGDYSDASRPPLATLAGGGLPVYKYEVPETVGTSGQLLDGGAVVESIGLPIYPDHELTQGTVTVSVAPSLAAAMTDGLDYLAHFEYECTEQIVSKFLPNLLTVRALQTAAVDDPALQSSLDTQVNIALQRLYSRQRSDGGWPWWDGTRSNALVTAYVVLGLLEAQASGYELSAGVLEDGVRYLRTNLPHVDGVDGRYKENRQAFLLYVLARAGMPATQEMNQLYMRRSALDFYAQGFLAQALYYTDAEDPRLAAFAADFISYALVSATGTHWEETERDYWNWNTDTRTTAIVLDTMIKLDPDNPLVANAVRWLMAHRVDGRWQGTQETAWTLMALTNWMTASGELQADYDYEIALNGQSLAQGSANASTLRDTQTLQIDITQLFTDELNRLGIGRSDGAGNLYYTTHLESYLPVDAVQPLDRGLILSRQYFAPDDHDTPITEMVQGETFLARLTIVVPHTLHYVVIEDFLPAGLEAVDQSLQISQQVGAPERYEDDEYGDKGWGWWYFSHIELRDEKVVLSADVLPAGTYEYVYLVRAAVPGEYRVIPPTGHEFYFPEVYGRGAGSIFTVVKP
ncbi:MAG: Ig-like domain-containing protein [Ardenticatenaceae bacterium]|nr:Ig-like domain-containing protein [Ardenticatenaceae bacterium]